MTEVLTIHRNGDGKAGRPTVRKVINGHEVSLTAFKLYEKLQAQPEMSVNQLARSLKLTTGRVYQCLGELYKAGVVSKRSGYTVEG